MKLSGLLHAPEQSGVLDVGLVEVKGLPQLRVLHHTIIRHASIFLIECVSVIEFPSVFECASPV